MNPDQVEHPELEEPDFGYHIAVIPRGTYGEFSKIKEEVLELEDALAQNNPIMALNELADLYGAMCGYMERHHPSIGIEGLSKMARATARAFQVGDRA